MYPWRKILVPTDFSTAAAWVFDDAIRAASLTGAEIMILHVRMTHPSKPELLRFPADASVYEYAEQQELDLLRRYVERSAQDLKTTLLVRTAPDPAAEIFRSAKEADVDLIVMATHARHHIAHLFIGSNTMKMLSRCSIPILAIRYGIKKRRATRTIAVPVESANTIPPVLKLVGEIARNEGSEVHLLSCASGDQRAAAAESLDRATAQLEGLIVRKSVIEAKSLGRELVRYSEANDIDLIAIPPDCDREGKLSGTADGIVRQASSPVLVVPG
ncbi:MAG: universal stress protein [Acidobacteriota bacterium]